MLDCVEAREGVRGRRVGMKKYWDGVGGKWWNTANSRGVTDYDAVPVRSRWFGENWGDEPCYLAPKGVQ